MKGIRNLYWFSETYIHPTYNPSFGPDVHDVGLIKIRERIRFDRDKVEPACLDFRSFKDFTRDQLQVSAWDSGMGAISPSNMLHTEDFEVTSVHKYPEGRNYIFATGVHTLGEGSFFGEQGKIFKIH